MAFWRHLARFLKQPVSLLVSRHTARGRETRHFSQQAQRRSTGFSAFYTHAFESLKRNDRFLSKKAKKTKGIGMITLKPFSDNPVYNVYCIKLLLKLSNIFYLNDDNIMSSDDKFSSIPRLILGRPQLCSKVLVHYQG